MSDAPLFVVAPPIRCFHRVADPDLAPCAAPAAWIRWRSSMIPEGYYCDRHRRPTDEPMAAEPLIRRVSVTLEVLFSAVNWLPGPAHNEALLRLETAVEEAGGVINLHTVNSVMGRCAGLPVAGRALAVRARPSPR